MIYSMTVYDLASLGLVCLCIGACVGGYIAYFIGYAECAADQGEQRSTDAELLTKALEDTEP